MSSKIVDQELIRDTDLKDVDIRVYSILRDYAGKERKTYVEETTIANDLKKSLRTVQRSMARLKAKGLVQVVFRGKHRPCWKILP